MKKRTIDQLIDEGVIHSSAQFLPTSEVPVNCNGFFLFAGAQINPGDQLPPLALHRCYSETDFRQIASRKSWTHWAYVIVKL